MPSDRERERGGRGERWREREERERERERERESKNDKLLRTTDMISSSPVNFFKSFASHNNSWPNTETIHLNYKTASLFFGTRKMHIGLNTNAAIFTKVSRVRYVCLLVKF